MNIKDIPIWNKGKWGVKSFESDEEFREYLKTKFKEPGKYEFDDTSFEFNKEAKKFEKDGFFCDYNEDTQEFIEYWNEQKKRCRNGVIYVGENNEWYLPSEYYMWLNFLPIFDKIKKKVTQPRVLDTQLHIALYELLGELHGKHAAITKKRQIASSYYHAAKLIKELWFEDSPTLKMGASDKEYVKQTWAFIEEYRNFLNTHTAWYRPMNPDSPLNWQQKQIVRINNRDKTIGNKGKLIGLSFEKSATKGVGGPARYFFHEEGGIAPRADETLIFMLSALASGEISTGQFIIAGSVGKLKDAGPLKEFTYKPDEYDIYAVDSDLIDETGIRGRTALFIPEQWSMMPFIDQYGNSLVEEAKEHLDNLYKEWKKNNSPEIYQLKVSQRPRNLKEAYDTRTVSKFRKELLARQRKKIEEGEYPCEYVDLSEDEDGKIEITQVNRRPISVFPINPLEEDKRGVISLYKRPQKNREYVASIDPVASGKTITSESLCSLIIMKLPMEVQNETGVEVEPLEMVLTWTGRYDDIEDTHNLLEMAIVLFQARTIIEANVSLFIQHMIKKGLQHLLVRKNELVFLKENYNTSKALNDFGWRNNGKMFTEVMIPYLKQMIESVTGKEYIEGTDKCINHYGIEVVIDIMIIKELEEYKDGMNVDRLISLSALAAYITIRVSNEGYSRIRENKEEIKKQLPKGKLYANPFSNLERGGFTSSKSNRSAFNNIRKKRTR